MHYSEALQNCIFRFISGSHQYGTNRPDSDVDYRGVFIAPLKYAFDIFQSSFVGSGTIRQTLRAAIEQIESGNNTGAINLVNDALQTDRGDLSIGVSTVHKPGADEELHELRKFLKLAADNNPNILEFLYVDHLVDMRSPVWDKIVANRDLFLSKRARWTFAGYAIQQMNRIKIHRGYLLHPPSHKPTRKEFGLSENSKVPREHQNAILSLPSEWVSDNAKDLMLLEKQYASALQLWNSYSQWEKQRNPARKELEYKFGFDVKHAMHLVRLSRMGVEILRDKQVLVCRPDAEELRGILRGEWTYEQIESIAGGLDSQLDELYKSSSLRDAPDRKRIAALYCEICEDRYDISLS